MPPLSNPAAAMIFGFIGSTLFHLSKGFQRHGIEALELFSTRKIRREAGEERPPKAGRKTALYVTGLVLNNSLGLFSILANRYAPSSYFTSMFGLGLITLMLYSGFVLKEPIGRLHYSGAGVLVVGTLILGYDAVVRPPLSMGGVHLPAAGIVFGLTLILGGALIYSARKKHSLKTLGVICGSLVGLSSGMDPVLKGIGQNFGESGRFLPKVPAGWAIFLASFFFATFSIVVSQWAFKRGVHASIIIPIQTFSFITYPIMFQAVALPGFALTGRAVLGLSVTVLGMAIMRTRNEGKRDPENNQKTGTRAEV
jgi:hypothetical protein